MPPLSLPSRTSVVNMKLHKKVNKVTHLAPTILQHGLSHLESMTLDCDRANSFILGKR